jgi:copper chaperone
MAGTANAQFKTSGMHCHSCAMLIDMTLDDLDGVESSKTDLASGKTDVQYDPDSVSVDDMIAAIRSAGYEAELAS